VINVFTAYKHTRNVDIDLASVGTCLPHHGRREGSACHRTSDCDFGLLCVISGGTGKICQQPSENVKQYSKCPPGFSHGRVLKSLSTNYSAFAIRELMDVNKKTKKKDMQNYIKRDFITDEDCAQSSECDVSKGLCCQLLRRHRQSPRKVSRVSQQGCSRRGSRKSGVWSIYLLEG
jgi:hypothetical protein